MEYRPLQVVPERLNAVRGGLDVIQLGKPALILRQCVQFIEEKLLQADQPKPDWRSMDTLADAITSVEYYLERLSDDPATTDDILQLARASVEALGYPLEDEQDFADNDIDVERIELEQPDWTPPKHDVDAWSGFSANANDDNRYRQDATRTPRWTAATTARISIAATMTNCSTQPWKSPPRPSPRRQARLPLTTRAMS